MWCELIRQWDDEVTFHEPATDADIRACELSLGQTMPSALRSLLRETNGVEGSYDLGVVLSTDQIRQTNREFRTTPDFAELYMPFDPLLFFGDAGNGDKFGYAMRGEPELGVFVWNHENDSRVNIAPSLRSYLENAITVKPYDAYTATWFAYKDDTPDPPHGPPIGES